MQELFEKKAKGFVNLYKNDYQMLLNTVKELFTLRTCPQKEGNSRTEDGYFIYKFGEIHDKFVLGKTSYRHIDPSQC